MNSLKMEYIIECIDQSLQDNISLTKGAIYHFDNLDYVKPTKCNALGAVLYCVSKEFNLSLSQIVKDLAFSKTLCEIFDINSFWVWRFSMGFDCGHQIILDITDKETKKSKLIEDKVSKLGLDIAKIYRDCLVGKL